MQMYVQYVRREEKHFSSGTHTLSTYRYSYRIAQEKSALDMRRVQFIGNWHRREKSISFTRAEEKTCCIHLPLLVRISEYIFANVILLTAIPFSRMNVDVSIDLSFIILEIFPQFFKSKSSSSSVRLMKTSRSFEANRLDMSPMCFLFHFRKSLKSSSIHSVRLSLMTSRWAIIVH